MNLLSKKSVALGAAMLLAANVCLAQAWPSKTVRLVVVFPPGGFVDQVARQIQPLLQSVLGQPVIIDNKGGAGGTIGAAEVARSEPDGHTFMLVFDNFATFPIAYPKLRFDIHKDFQPVTQVVSNPLILVASPGLPAKDPKSLVKLLKAHPDKYNYASVGPGSSGHLTAELFKSVTNTSITHVAYRGGGPAIQDLMGGQVEMAFFSASAVLPHIQAHKLQAIAQTGAKRAPALAQVPTMAESGFPDFQVNSWVGLLAPAGTPKNIVDKMQSEVRKIVTEPAFVQRLQEQGVVPVANTPEQFTAQIKAEQAKWERLVVERKLSFE